MISYRLYLYDSSQEANGYKGQEYTKYILQGAEINNNLDDTLDTLEITLNGLSFREEFAPSTKFILELWDNSGGTDLFYADYHIQVANDTVSQPIMENEEYFSHHISFIEAISEAQNRLVDNISVTYKLKDVDLNIPVSYDSDLPVKTNIQNIEYVPSENFGEWSGFLNWRSRRVGHKFKWVMPNWYIVNIDGNDIYPSDFDWNDLKYYQIADSGGNKTVEFPVPMLEVSASIADTKTFRKNGYASIETVITKTNRTTGITEVVDIITTNPDSTDTNEQWTTDPMRTLNAGWIESRPWAGSYRGPGDLWYVASKLSKVADFDNSKLNRKISLTMEAGYSYNIQFRLKTYDLNNISGSGYIDPLERPQSEVYDKNPAYFGFGEYVSYLFITVANNDNPSPLFTNNSNPQFAFSMACTYEEDNIDVFLKSAPPATALELLQKSVLATQDHKKQLGKSVLKTETTFYVGDNDYQRLGNVQIVENFYNQKNLFEILMDIGKYIHARPKARFGSNNRYIIEWLEYGKTEQFEDTNTKLSIFNSRFIEEYISSVSSYVTNMVQLGGEIVETVAPKSSSEDFLVYNDVAEIKLTRPIIEILEVRAIDKNGTSKDITKYVYEESIYQLLPITRTPFEEEVYDTLTDFPATGQPNIIYIALDQPGIFYTWNNTAGAYSAENWIDYNEISKGMAIYYGLGDNVIKGLNYRLPTINAGEQANDYAIKRILAKVFEISSPTDVKKLKVNDYTFKVRYRTKDDLRVNQSRPDIRDYLLSSKFDKFPQHQQFNNQEDVLVDSVKFGNNVYGKLIRTGNTVYTYNEIVTSLGELKQVGQLYNIQGNIYYVSKVKNIIFSEYVLSQVEFSKDFNRLSQIIGIPSEPRFYEISERSSINRAKTFDDFLVLGTTNNNDSLEGSFIRNKGLEYVENLLFDNEKYPQYVVTYFKNDKDSLDPTYPNRETFSISVCHPASTYSIQNTLTTEWSMADNFSAGDKVELTTKSIYETGTIFDKLTTSLGSVLNTEQSAIDSSYNTLIPVKYCDANGRADLVDFAIIKEFEPTRTQTLNFPENPFETIPSEEYLFGNEEIEDFGKNDRGQILLKDNREVISFNYNLQMITDSDRFVLSAYMWQKEKSNIKLGLLKQEINKISNDTIPNNSFLLENIDFSHEIVNNQIIIDIENALDDIDISEAKAIVVYSTNETTDYMLSGAKYFVFGRNIGGLDEIEARKNWKISNYNKDMFKKQ
jgi:hypothetical protein